MMEDYVFGTPQQPGTLMHSIEAQDESGAYLQYPCNENFDRFDGLGLDLADGFGLDTLQPSYLDNSADLLNIQTMPQLPLHDDKRLAALQHQPINFAPNQSFVHASPCSSHITQQRTMPHMYPQSSMHVHPDMTRSMSAAALSVSSMTTPPHLGPFDYSSSWPTPELEPTTLEEIDAWMPLEQLHRRSPGSTTSSAATPPSHPSRASSLESIPHFQPTSAQKDKPRCWEHGCNGRTFSTYGNYTRHCRERSDKRPQRKCPRCGALFSRSTARNQHLAKNACNRIRRFSNGRQRPEFTTTATNATE